MKRHLWMIHWIPLVMKFMAQELWIVLRTKLQRGGRR